MSASASNLPRPKNRKAGILLVEWDKTTQQWMVLAPFCTRFDGAIKAPTLAKGTRKPGQSKWDGAVMEMLEETGIDVDRLRRGGYEGVHVVDAKEQGIYKHKKPSLEPVTSINASYRGLPTQLDLFIIEVEGLNNLRAHFKQNIGLEKKDWLPEYQPVKANGKPLSLKQLGMELPKAFQAETLVEQNPDCPDFATLLKVLRENKLPGKLREKDSDGTLFAGDPALPIFEEADDWIREQAARRAGQKAEPFKKVETREDLNGLYARWVRNPLSKFLLDQVSDIRRHLYKLEILSDKTGPKLDDKDNLLQYFVEGAEVIPFPVYIERMIAFAEKNEHYRDRMYVKECRDLESNRSAQCDSTPETLQKIYESLMQKKVDEMQQEQKGKLAMANGSAKTALGAVKLSRDLPKSLQQRMQQLTERAAEASLAA